MIVAIGHHKNTGKDTFVRFCIDILRSNNYKGKVLRKGFADNLYDICFTLYKWAGFQPRIYYQENPNAKNDKLATGLTVRETLIKLGNVMRGFDSDIWINSALRSVDCDLLFISDLRYPNEILHCKSVKAITVKIDRPGLPVPTDEADIALDSWTDWDLIIGNDGTQQAFYDKAERFCDEYIVRNKSLNKAEIHA